MDVTWTQGERYSIEQWNTCHRFWRSLHRKKCALRAVRPVCVQHRQKHDSEGIGVAVPVTTAYRGSGRIYLFILTTALYGVSSIIDNHLIRAGWVPGWILPFLEIWKAVQPCHSGLPDIGAKISSNYSRRCWAIRFLNFRFYLHLYHMLGINVILIWIIISGFASVDRVYIY